MLLFGNRVIDYDEDDTKSELQVLRQCARNHLAFRAGIRMRVKELLLVIVRIDNSVRSNVIDTVFHLWSFEMWVVVWVAAGFVAQNIEQIQALSVNYTLTNYLIIINVQ